MQTVEQKQYLLNVYIPQVQKLGTMAWRLGESLHFRKPWGLAVNVDSDARDGLRR